MDDKDLKVLLARMMEKQDLDSDQIRELDTKIDTLLQESLPELRIEIATLKVRSGIWGAAAGCIPVIIMIALKLLG